MTETPGYGPSERTRRRILVGLGLVGAALAIGGGAYAVWALNVEPAVLHGPPIAEGVAPNETLSVSVRDAPADVGPESGERVFTIEHRGGTRVFYRNLRVVVYDAGVPILSLTAPEWTAGSLVLSEDGTVPLNASSFAPGDRLTIAELPNENAAILDDGDVYVVALVDAESGRTLSSDTIVLE